MSSEFGGKWTEDKLDRVKKYLSAYTTIMSKQNFTFAYIDAFAGTGYRNSSLVEGPNVNLFQELFEEEAVAFLDGSARIALQVEPRFERYIFIEKDSDRFEELKKLKLEFPHLSDNIRLVNEDANIYLEDLCRNRNWKSHRAVLFLDPFGMQVSWTLLEAIAATRAIDLWYLFPLGVAVNRLLRRDGQIPESLQRRLNSIFGDDGWFDAFYRPKSQLSLFDEIDEVDKTADFDAIKAYFVTRLKTIFAGVAENPLELKNSRNNPLYLLCFAAANERGAKTAINIAQDILASS